MLGFQSLGTARIHHQQRTLNYEKPYFVVERAMPRQAQEMAPLRSSAGSLREQTFSPKAGTYT